ncbi:hypothetical protein FHW16_001718 [Phyllobacterium myrsinacearum]|uniref:Uncharacterized protein n=1 Tax=Phyllobacterium myrsinacearum TaxID=28101 RepID=A0A839EKM4_9HYPH|nr:hypothetical protein [Phyllobacterium myrsinacearum]
MHALVLRLGLKGRTSWVFPRELPPMEAECTIFRHKLGITNFGKSKADGREFWLPKRKGPLRRVAPQFRLAQSCRLAFLPGASQGAYSTERRSPMESIRRLVAVCEITRHQITSFSFVEHKLRMGCIASGFKRKFSTTPLAALESALPAGNEAHRFCQTSGLSIPEYMIWSC